jgi:hypothetical protein
LLGLLPGPCSDLDRRVRNGECSRENGEPCVEEDPPGSAHELEREVDLAPHRQQGADDALLAGADQRAIVVA